MITYELNLICDLCQGDTKALFTSDVLEAPDADEARRQAHEVGWTFAGATCICPECGAPERSSRKKAVNLTLSEDAIKKGGQLKRAMNRPSLSNVVEQLIVEKSEAVKGAA